MATSIQDNIIEKLGLENLPVEEQADLLNRMSEIIQIRLAARVMKLLPESSYEEYLKISDDDEEGGHNFLAANIPNYLAIIEEEITKFKQEITA